MQIYRVDRRTFFSSSNETQNFDASSLLLPHSPRLEGPSYIYIYIYSHRENSGWNCGQRTQTGKAEMARILTLRHRSFCFVLDSLFEGYGLWIMNRFNPNISYRKNWKISLTHKVQLNLCLLLLLSFFLSLFISYILSPTDSNEIRFISYFRSYLSNDST